MSEDVEQPHGAFPADFLIQTGLFHEMSQDVSKDLLATLQHNIRIDLQRQLQEQRQSLISWLVPNFSEVRALIADCKLSAPTNHLAEYDELSVKPEAESGPVQNAELQAGNAPTECYTSHYEEPKEIAFEEFMVKESSIHSGKRRTRRRSSSINSTDPRSSEASTYDDLAATIGSYLIPPSSFTMNADMSWRNIKEPRSLLARAMQGNFVTCSVSMIILANTAFVGYETNNSMYRALHGGEDANPILGSIGTAFTITFTLEIGLRIIALRAWFLFCPDWKWNIFDLFLVISGWLQELYSTSNFTYLRTLRIFRVIRIARIFRMLRFMCRLRQMVIAIVQSLRSLAWAFALLLLIMYVVAIFLMQAATNWLEDNGTSGEDAKALQLHYGSLGDALLTLIQAISGGADWDPMAGSLAKQSELYRIAFIGYVIFVVFGVLNVLTGVFVADAAAVKDRQLVVQAENDSKKQFIQEMKSLFDDLDDKRSGYITWYEFQAYMSDMNIQAYFSAHDLDPTDVRLLFQMLDHNNLGEIKTMDFLTGCLKLKGVARTMQVKKLDQDLHECFRKLSSQVKSVEAVFSELKQVRSACGLKAAALRCNGESVKKMLPKPCSL